MWRRVITMVLLVGCGGLTPGSGQWAQAAELPPPPDSVTGQPDKQGSGRVDLQWTYSAANPSYFTIAAQQGSPPSETTCASGCIHIGQAGGDARYFGVADSLLGGDAALYKPWYFAVSATNDAGEGPVATVGPITPWRVTTLAVGYPTATPSYVPATGSTPSDYRMTLRWTPPSAAWTTIVLVQVKSATPSNSETSGVVYSCTKSSSNACTGTSKLVTGLAGGSTYSWTFWTYNSEGNKQRATVTTLARAPGVYLNGGYATGSSAPGTSGSAVSAYDSAGNQNVVYPRADGMYYGRRLAGRTTWAWTRIPHTTVYDHFGWISARSDGSLVYLFERDHNNSTLPGAFVQTRSAGGTWSSLSRISGTDAHYHFLSAAQDSVGRFHVALYFGTVGASGMYYVKGKPGAWSALHKMAGVGSSSQALLTLDTTRTKLAVVTRALGSTVVTYTAIKSTDATSFPTAVKRAGVTSSDQVLGMSIYGTRVQLFISRYIGAGNSGNGIFLERGTRGGTSTAPTITWSTAAPSRVAGTTSKDKLGGVATCTNGKMALAFYRGSTESTAGIYLMESSTSGTWNVTAPVRRAAAIYRPYEHLLSANYFGSGAYAMFVRS